MRYKGKQLSAPKPEVLVIPREDEDIVFQAQAVMDYSPFELISPEPEPPEKMLPGGKKTKDFQHPAYQERMADWMKKRQLWLILESLKVSEGVEWETVDLNDPETYENYWDELAKSGFNEMERAMIRNLALKANSVDDQKMEEARQRFLQSRGASSEGSTSPKDEAKNT